MEPNYTLLFHGARGGDFADGMIQIVGVESICCVDFERVNRIAAMNFNWASYELLRMD